ncbi:carcinoembryonic antigen-related cell adhesion molecule 1-like [Ylistrum balloti]|uniref:carcinoembryonic antigen-related cell adhesion molecule 1-like n=1 Tax=Ylistrum balloti TaxID=509963 RepID=UPI002905ADA5|nr:carcinoembryonic antigen-related cell adhesion molecule 1-like [Ylistrum balloti]
MGILWIFIVCILNKCSVGHGASTTRSPSPTYYDREKETSPDIWVRAQPPTITPIPLKDVYYEGENVTLICFADGNPPVTYSWTRNNSPVSGSSRLHLIDIRIEQSGVYVCEGTNFFEGNIFKQSRSVNITIVEKSIKPVHINLHVRLAENVLTLTCSVDDTLDYKWLLDGVKVGAGSKLVLSSGDSSGQYVCVAKNTFTGKTYHGNRSVNVKIEPTQNEAGSIYITGIVFICIAVPLLLVTVGLGLFISRNNRLPCYVRNEQDEAGLPRDEHPSLPAENTRERRESDYQQLESSAVAGPSVYDVLERRSTRSVSGDSPAEQSYEMLQDRSSRAVYDELHV